MKNTMNDWLYSSDIKSTAKIQYEPVAETARKWREEQVERDISPVSVRDARDWLYSRDVKATARIELGVRS